MDIKVSPTLEQITVQAAASITRQNDRPCAQPSCLVDGPHVDFGHAPRITLRAGLLSLKQGHAQRMHPGTHGPSRPRMSSSAMILAMATKHDLVDWLMEALEASDGQGSIAELCREVWQRHEPDLRISGDLFYTWQYDI